MAATPSDTLPESWHRHFAAQANNRAWNLAEARGDAMLDHDLLNAAHAAAWHWSVVGTELHHMRATMLLAHVHALLGPGRTAWGYAESMRRAFLAWPETPDWELAFVHAIHAHAACVAGEHAAHAASWEEAQRCVEAIADPEDRAIVLKTWAQVPAP
jgi:hypothetical protein